MLTQNYEAYTVTEQQIWARLSHRQLLAINPYAYRAFMESLAALGLDRPIIPRFNTLNRALQSITGWTIVEVDAPLANDAFFEQLLYRRFPASVHLRQTDHPDQLGVPDMFHDVFGHAPLLADPIITMYLHGLARIAEQHQYQPKVVDALFSLYWHTIEYGLVYEKEEKKILGAGILASAAETNFCISGMANLVPFDCRKAVSVPCERESFHKSYFILKSSSELISALEDMRTIFE